MISHDLSPNVFRHRNGRPPRLSAGNMAVKNIMYIRSMSSKEIKSSIYDLFEPYQYALFIKILAAGAVAAQAFFAFLDFFPLYFLGTVEGSAKETSGALLL